MNPKLLVVDDDEIIRILAQDMLEQYGYTVQTAEEGEAAWALVDRSAVPFDLVLLDKQMPKLGGIALLKRIKADSRFKDLPVILMTSDSRQEDIAEGLAEGASYYLTKPLVENILKFVVKNALEDFVQFKELRTLVGQQSSSMTLLRSADFCFRTMSEAKDLALLLADLSMYPERTVNGYLELLINAVEHGNLAITYDEKGQLLREDRWLKEIESRLLSPQYSGLSVNVTLLKTPSASIVTISDQGKGFDWQAYMEFSSERMFDLHGRGIAVSKSACFDDLEYLGNGSSVVVTVRLPCSPA